MELFSKIKSTWLNLNLILKIIILFILLGAVVVSIDLGAYTIALLIILVSLLGVYGGIKNKKTAQTIVSIIFVISVAGSLISDIGKEKERISNAKESSNTVQNTNNKIDENSEDNSINTNNLVIEEGMPNNILNALNVDQLKNLLDIKYTDLGEDKIAVLKMNLPSNLTSKDMLKNGFINAKNIINLVDKKYKDDITKYEFWFLGDVVDSSGNKNQQKLLSFEYSRNTINNINWDGITIDMFMQQAENTYIHPAFNN